MSYKIKRDSTVLAILHSKWTESKLVTKEKTYRHAEQNGEYYVFQVTQPSRWKAFKVHFDDVVIVPDIKNIPDGTYTVVLGPETNSVTVRLETDGNRWGYDNMSPNFFWNKQVLSYQEGDIFVAFGHIDESGGLHVKRKFQGRPDMHRYQGALDYLQWEIENENTGGLA